MCGGCGCCKSVSSSTRWDGKVPPSPSPPAPVAPQPIKAQEEVAARGDSWLAGQLHGCRMAGNGDVPHTPYTHFPAPPALHQLRAGGETAGRWWEVVFVCVLQVESGSQPQMTSLPSLLFVGPIFSFFGERGGCRFGGFNKSLLIKHPELAI